MATVILNEFSPPGGCGRRSAWNRLVECAFPWGQEAESYSRTGRQPESKAVREPVVSSFVLDSSQLLFLKGQKWSKFI